MGLNVNTVMFYFASFGERLKIGYHDPRTQKFLILVDVS